VYNLWVACQNNYQQFIAQISKYSQKKYDNTNNGNYFSIYCKQVPWEYVQLQPAVVSHLMTGTYIYSTLQLTYYTNL